MADNTSGTLKNLRIEGHPNIVNSVASTVEESMNNILGRIDDLRIPGHADLLDGPLKGSKLAYRNYATRADMPVNAIAGMLGGTGRITSKNRVPFTKIKLWFPLFTLQSDGAKTTEQLIAGNITLAASLEYPRNSGTIYQFTFKGGTIKPTVTAAAENGWLVTDELTLPVEIPAEAQFGIRTFIQCAAVGAFYGSVFTSGASFSEGGAYSAATPVDSTTGAAPADGFTFVYGPAAILTQGTAVSVAISGTSHGYGSSDGADGDGNFGAWAKFIRRAGLSYIKVAATGEVLNLIDDVGFSRRLALLVASNIGALIVASVTNEIATGQASTTAALKTIHQKFTQRIKSAIPGLLVIAATVQPRTTSSDTWITAGNQAAATNFGPLGNGVREAWNALLRTGDISDFVDGWLDYTRAGESKTVPGTYIVSGAANYATSDGIHYSPALHTLTANGMPTEELLKIVA